MAKRCQVLVPVPVLRSEIIQHLLFETEGTGTLTVVAYLAENISAARLDGSLDL